MVLSKNVNGKLLRCGYTTGVCAAAAAKAAAIMLFSGMSVDSIDLVTPSGIPLNLYILSIDRSQRDAVSCAVKKDAGDDPDVTDGTLIFARVEKQFNRDKRNSEGTVPDDLPSASGILDRGKHRNGQPDNKVSTVRTIS